MQLMKSFGDRWPLKRWVLDLGEKDSRYSAISENQGLDKSSSVSNLRKISEFVHLNFFSVCHLDFFQVYGTNLKKIQLTN